MDIIEELQKELKSEYEITKKFLEHYPEDKNDWKPHDKSMSMKTLAVHVVEIFAWPDFIMKTEYLDFEKTPYKQPDLSTRAELQKKLEEDYKKGAETLKNLTPEQFDGTWDIRQGDMVFQKWSKYGAIRHSFKQITHHRAQLGVYYRLNDIFVPGSYGPSADEQ
ncbi:damage-inducible protein DinB [Flavobacteriaceae bacterium F89]|uniref:Damage-inducible protein DinB n=1 Tax=Cerina litoralis TaxID=2874477 RepID=A0AAE3EWN1_9FLAO|nr:DinB family protein [Cerina litoralis]MCG2461860.1 damage-inducible protein DinB [Cerina litoralis]